MQARLTAGRWTMRVGTCRQQSCCTTTTNRIWNWKNEQRRHVVGKASSPAAVHGAKPPLTDTVNVEEVERKIHQGQERENKEKMEKVVETQLNQPQESESGPPTK